MKRYFRTIQNVMDSRWGNFQYAGTTATQKTDRVLQSSKLEDCIYRDLSKDDENLETIQQEAAPKLRSFPALSRDIFQSFYSLFPKRTDAANQAESKTQQAEAVAKMVDVTARQNKAAISESVSAAVGAAAEKAKEVQTILGAWSDDAGTMEKNASNTELLQKVRHSPALLDISKHLGRFREIFAQGKRNGYAYGRGETYALELGNDLSRAIGSEFAMLASPQTLPLFVKKYQQRRLKQYRRREPVHKGMGDIICCLDESGSTRGDAAAWGKAVALTLLDIAAENRRKFALIHFAGSSSCKVDVFLPGQFSVQDKMNAAETFLNGGTDFKRPLGEAIQLMDIGFENADIVFLTDGLCELPEDYLETLRKVQAARKFTVTGILLDAGNPDMDFSLTPFCQKIYRTSELAGDEIVRGLVTQRA